MPHPPLSPWDVGQCLSGDGNAPCWGGAALWGDAAGTADSFRAGMGFAVPQFPLYVQLGFPKSTLHPAPWGSVPSVAQLIPKKQTEHQVSLARREAQMDFIWGFPRANPHPQCMTVGLFILLQTVPPRALVSRGGDALWGCSVHSRCVSSVRSRSELSQRHCSGINPAPAPQPSIQPAQRASFILIFNFSFPVDLF